MDIFKFMSDSPVLTFFLALIIGQVLIYAFKYISIMFRGYDPNPEPEEKEDADCS